MDAEGHEERFYIVFCRSFSVLNFSILNSTYELCPILVILDITATMTTNKGRARWLVQVRKHHGFIMVYYRKHKPHAQHCSLLCTFHRPFVSFQSEDLNFGSAPSFGKDIDPAAFATSIQSPKLDTSFGVRPGLPFYILSSRLRAIPYSESTFQSQYDFSQHEHRQNSS